MDQDQQSMRRQYSRLRDWMKRHDGAATIARRAIRLVPDVPVTLNVPDLGPFRFGLRRHRWLFGSDPLGGGHVATLRMFRRLIRPGDVFYDVGANIGYYLRWVSGHLPIRHAVAFEPMTANIKLLRANVALGRSHGRVTVLPVALSDADGDEALQIDDMADGSAVLDSVSGGRAARGRSALGLPPKAERVAVRRLDAIIAERSLPLPDVMKIDTEGAEGAVLRGAATTLANSSPRLIIATHGPERVREVIDALGPHGYACYGRLGLEETWGRLHPDNVLTLADNNVVCAKNEADIALPFDADVSKPQP
jgi:FkbM family methyltransferase